MDKDYVNVMNAMDAIGFKSVFRGSFDAVGLVRLDFIKETDREKRYMTVYISDRGNFHD